MHVVMHEKLSRVTGMRDEEEMNKHESEIKD
jgi:hypothetical protein